MSVVMSRCLRLSVKNKNKNKQLSFSQSGKSFGSAAAQVDYDEDYYYPDYNKTAEEEERGVQWVIMGDPTIRRHVYADRLSKILGVPHISMGTLVRQELNPNSPLYKRIASAVNQGKLVPEDVIFSLLSKRLDDGYCRGETGFIIHGIPRTTLQAKILDQIADIDLVLNLKSTDEVVAKNTLSNGIYSASRSFHSMVGSGFNINFQPQVGHLQTESDITMKDKLRLYEEQKKPLEEYYKRQKKLFDFQVAGAPGDTWEGLLAALHLRNTNTNVVTSATNFSQKLTA